MGGGCCASVQWDEVAAYKTQKYVSIRDKRLGLLKYSLMFAIFAYVVLYEVVYQAKYLKLENPVGTARFSLREPSVYPGTNKTCDTVKHESCVLKMPTVGTFGYCGQSAGCAGRNSTTQPVECYDCTIWDAIEAKNVQDKSVLITTHVQTLDQTRQPCSVDPTANEACPRVWNNAAQGYSDYFVAGIEDFTLLIDHTFTTPSIGISRTAREMDGVLRSTNEAYCATVPKSRLNSTFAGGCTVMPAHMSEGLPYFTVQELLDVAGLDLDDADPGISPPHTYRNSGVVLQVNLAYTNWREWYGVMWYNRVTYTISANTITGSSYKFEVPSYAQDLQSRVVQTKYGMRVSVLQTGEIAVLDMTTFLLQLTTSLTLLGMATFVVDLLALYVMGDRKVYNKAKYEQTAKFNKDFGGLLDRSPEEEESLIANS